ncbi:MAG: carbohydrate ABC transporter permease [Mycobacteriales bacterium]
MATTSVKKRAPWTRKDRAALGKALLFLSPWILGTLAFTVFPLVYSIVISFARYTGLSGIKWLGVQNYTRLFSDPLLGKSALNTMWYGVFAVPIGLVIALLLALAMNRRVREVAVYRTILYLPSLIPIFAFSFIFVVLLNPGYGIINKFLSAFGVATQNYLGDPVGAKGVIIGMAQFAAGNAALIFLAGLNNVPETLYDAAKVDGANAFRRFRSITLPLLSPVILFNAINGINAALQVFIPAYIITNGGPNNSTLFYLFYLYKNAFSYAQLGYASAMAVILFLVGIALALLVFGLSRRYVHYGLEV